MNRIRKSSVWLVLFAALLSLSACGSGGKGTIRSPDKSAETEITATPELAATLTPTDTLTPEPTATPAPTDTPAPEPAATVTPTDTPAPEPTATVTPTNTPTPEPTATPTPSNTPTPEPTTTPTPSNTPTPEPTATPVPTNTPAPKPPENTGGESAADSGTVAQTSFVLNRSTKKYHLPNCRDVPRIKAENRWDYNGSGAEVEGMGYSPCGHCHPDRYW